MPRDVSAIEQGHVVLPGNRKGRVCPADDAGQFRVEVAGACWLDRLVDAGLIDRDQHDAGTFEEASTRPRVTGGYTGPGGRSSEYFLERLDAKQLAAWRRLGRLLAVVPPACRPSVEDAVFWDRRPESIQRLRRGLGAIHATVYGRRPSRP